MNKLLNCIIIFLFLSVGIEHDTVAGEESDVGYYHGEDYPNHLQLSQRLHALADRHPQLTKLESLVQTDGGKEIWLLSVGSGEIANRPAIAVVGGVSGDHLLGSELALQFAERVLASAHDQRVRNLLDSVSFYIFPSMSPDAREQYFAPLRYQRLGNANPTDLDRDGRIGEDPYNDLNNDGMITQMRIKDPTGNWMLHPEDNRIMVKARPEKGERGAYILHSEGIDMDKDGQFNEDGEEGVFFNRNFSFQYPVFERGAGHHALSEKETIAIAEFLFNAKNVFAVISFGDANNLSEPLVYNEKDASIRIPVSWKENDIVINQKVSGMYKNYLKEFIPDAAPGDKGDFFQWAYYHYGRFSFSTQGWTFPVKEKHHEEEIVSKELDFLNWAEQNQLEDVFIPWTLVEHPDFPNKQVEVGGIAPFVMKNPPYSMVESMAEKHTAFILELASLRPCIDIINLETEKLGTNLHRISADVINKGSFPTASQIGEQLRWVQKTVLRASLDDNQQIMGGKLVEVIGVIDGNSSEKRSWLIHGSGTVTIRAGAESSGFREIKVKL